MAFWDRWRPASPVPAARVANALDQGSRLGRALVGGRVTLDYGQPFGPLGALGYIPPPPDAEHLWAWHRLDSQALARIPIARLLVLLADVSPDIGKALWDWQRFNNPGYEVHAYRPGTETIDARAEARVQAFLARLLGLYGAVDVLLAGLFAGPFFRGAFFAELVLDERGRLPIDLVTPDPAIARFRRMEDPQRGAIWQLGQYGLGGFTVLDRLTVRYLPLDPAFSPYGRPLLAPAIFSSLFLVALLHDLRRVVQQQGYPRIDLAVDFEKLKALIPNLDKLTLPEWEAFSERVMARVQEVYAKLQPEDMYAHDTSISLNRPVGTVSADSLGAIDPLIRALERFLARGLKSTGFLMGSSESTTETQAIRQFEAFTQSIRAVQHHAEALLGYLFTLGLQAEGILAEVRWRFAESRASEELRDQQVRKLKIANAQGEWMMGWISQDEAATRVTGHKADVPEPRILPAPEAWSSAQPAPPIPERPGQGVAPGAVVGNGAVHD